MNEAKGTDPLRVTLVSYPPYPVRSARRAGPSGRRSDGRGTEGDDKRSESETRSDRQAKPKGTEMANGEPRKCRTVSEEDLRLWLYSSCSYSSLVTSLRSSYPCGRYHFPPLILFIHSRSGKRP